MKPLSLPRYEIGRRFAASNLLAALIGSTMLVACGGEDAVDAPGGRELLMRVQDANYRNWRRAPGWDSRLPSVGDGHGGQLDIYVNETVSAVVASGTSGEVLPPGSTIVKDVWDGDTLHAIAIMDKRSDGWYWAEFDGREEVSASGHPRGCIECHRRGADYIRAFSLP